MSVTVQVLFDQPQHEIASLLRDRLTRCAKASLVAGFMTVEGIEAIAAPLRAHPSKLTQLVVGAATWRALDALDRLLAAGVAPAALHVHLGHTRPTAGIKNPFARYHPMLHSKALRANEDETFTPREFRLEGAEGSSESCPCSRDRSMRRPVTARTEAVGRR